MAVARSAKTGLDRIVRIAGQFFHAPISVLSVAGAERTFPKSDQKICLHEICRAASACAQAIPDVHPLVVPYAALDERFASLTGVSSRPGIRFYAGAPLIAGGARMGTLAILDTSARAPLSQAEIGALQDFAALAEREIERAGLAPAESPRN